MTMARLIPGIAVKWVVGNQTILGSMRGGLRPGGFDIPTSAGGDNFMGVNQLTVLIDLECLLSFILANTFGDCGGL